MNLFPLSAFPKGDFVFAKLSFFANFDGEFLADLVVARLSFLWYIYIVIIVGNVHF